MPDLARLKINTQLSGMIRAYNKVVYVSAAPELVPDQEQQQERQESEADATDAADAMDSSQSTLAPGTCVHYFMIGCEMGVHYFMIGCEMCLGRLC